MKQKHIEDTVKCLQICHGQIAVTTFLWHLCMDRTGANNKKHSEVRGHQEDELSVQKK